MTIQRFVLLGHPVAHSISPAMHLAAYHAMGASHEYVAWDCPDEASVRAGLQRLRSGALNGANVTIPWKREALRLADAASPRAQRVGAANVLVRRPDGSLLADNTDVLGLLAEWRALRAGRAVDRAIVLGSGGAALAAVVAAQEQGASSVLVTARSWHADQTQREWRRADEFVALGAELAPWPEPASVTFKEQLAAADLLVQATSAGMQGADSGEPLAERISWGALPDTALCYDVVYNPPQTPFLLAAKRAGLAASGGLGMLVEQALAAAELWLGERPPRGPMEQAARAALFAQGSSKGTSDGAGAGDGGLH